MELSEKLRDNFDEMVVFKDLKKTNFFSTLMPFSKIYELMKIAEEAGRITNFKPCGDCELRFICGGGCRAEHFKTFTQIDDATNIDFDSIPPRKCDREHKEKFYRLMINTNERFFC